MDGCKVAAVSLMEIGLEFSLHGDRASLVDVTLYKQLVGSLLYLTNTWLDISFPIGLLCQFSAKPRQTHWKAGL